MPKKIAVINDLSGFGRCSLTAAISVLSVMGVQPVPLPTAILTAQTGYDSYYCDDYTDKMKYFREEWAKMQAHFDGIYTGYVASIRQIDEIFYFLDTFRTPDTFLLVDPVMGDDGMPYSMFSEELCSKMKQLVKKADIITPNLTELCLLTDTDFHSLCSLKDSHELFDRIQKLSRSLCSSGTNTVITTGIPYIGENGEQRVGNLYITANQHHLASVPYIGGSYSGTGDLFASCMAGAAARGTDIPAAMETASGFLAAALKDTLKQKIPRNDGINYENYLFMLLENSSQLQDAF